MLNDATASRMAKVSTLSRHSDRAASQSTLVTPVPAWVPELSVIAGIGSLNGLSKPKAALEPALDRLFGSAEPAP